MSQFQAVLGGLNAALMGTFGQNVRLDSGDVILGRLKIKGERGSVNRSAHISTLEGVLYVNQEDAVRLSQHTRITIQNVTYEIVAPGQADGKGCVLFDVRPAKKVTQNVPDFRHRY